MNSSPSLSRRILIVDDDVDNAVMLGKLLDACGHTTVCAHEGGSAIELAKLFFPQVAVLDLSMPGMSGYELAKSLRAIFGNEVRLVAHSAWSDEQLTPEILSAGFDYRLIKPARFEEIQSAVLGAAQIWQNKSL